MTKDEALKLALEALEGVLDDSPKVLDASIAGGLYEVVQCRDAITAIKEALEQSEQEPVAWAMYQRGMLISFWMDKGDAYDFEFTSEHRWEPLYTSPPAQRTWVSLTDDEIENLMPDDDTPMSLGEAFVKFARALEAAHGIKGEA